MTFRLRAVKSVELLNLHKVDLKSKVYLQSEKNCFERESGTDLEISPAVFSSFLSSVLRFEVF